MLDRQLVRESPDLVRQGIARKGMDAPLDEYLALDAEWRSGKAELDRMRGELAQASKEIGKAKASGADASEAMARTKRLSAEIKSRDEGLRELEARAHNLELLIPNLPHESAPTGAGPEDNVVVEEWGEKPRFDFEPKPHYELCEKNGTLQLERGAKIAGSGFIVYSGWGARLERALINFMADLHVQRHGYTEVFVPFLANRQTMTGTGQLPKFEFDMYRLPEDDLFLVPTAEVPVTNIHQDEILRADDLTLNYCCYTACFRREAGAAGRETRGLLRVHQFNKVELVKFTKPEDSYDEMAVLLRHSRVPLEELGVHFRVVLMCTADMSFSNAKQYDLEVWAPGVERYLEVSSCSNFEAFQARRARIRFRREQGSKPEFVHTLNSSGVACPRLFAALVEANQRPDGSIVVPEALRRYVGTDRIPGPD